MRRTATAFLAGLLTLPLPAARAAGPPPSPFLVADLNRLPVESHAFPSAANNEIPAARPVEVNGVLYFPATDPAHGEELWRSNGTAAGTWQVSDIRPGPAGSRPRSLTTHNGRLYFVADDGVWGAEIWTSDGTRSGTLLLADLCPGPCTSAMFGDTSMASSGGRLFFAASRAGSFYKTLWVSDGTRQGTTEIAPSPTGVLGLDPLAPGVMSFQVIGGNGYELWRTDGTPGGTFRLLLPSGAPILNPYFLTSFGDHVIFWLYDELWRTDGTPGGTELVDSAHHGAATAPVVWNGLAYFANSRGEILASDGTPLGTGRLSGGFSTGYGLAPTAFTASACGPVFAAADSARQTRIWRIGGPGGSVEAVSEPPAAPFPFLAGPWSVGDRVFYAIGSYTEKTSELWKIEAPSCRPEKVEALCGPDRPCGFVAPFLLAGAGGSAFFVLNTAAEGAELWRSDGTAAGTFELRDIGFDPGSAGLSEIAALNGAVIFPALTHAGQAGLWRSDGTAAGTRSVKGVPWPQAFFSAGNVLYFTYGAPRGCGDWQNPCRGLWRTDGTRGGTRLLSLGVFGFQGLAFEGGRLLLSAADDPRYFAGSGLEPWLSDGTTAGTHRVSDINQQLYYLPFEGPPGVGSSSPGPAVWTGSAFLFAADDGLSGRELWMSDGTAAATRKLVDINPHDHALYGENYPGSAEPSPLTRLGSVFLLAADDGVSGRELWATDGTAPGTRRVRDLRPGAAGSSPHDLAVAGGRLYFLADDGGGEALWTSNGTEAGTVRVAPLAYQGRPSWGRSLTVAGGRLFFAVDNDVLGTELWTSDGTAAGTHLVRDLRPGPSGSYPQSLTAVDDLLVFAADDGATGLEPWVSDGTPQGTRLLGNLAAGPDASSPGPFTAAGPYLFFGAWDGVHGRELWAITRSGLKVSP